MSTEDQQNLFKQFRSLFKQKNIPHHSVIDFVVSSNGDKFDLYVDNVLSGTILDAKFCNSILEVYFGDNPRVPKFKDAVGYALMQQLLK